MEFPSNCKYTKDHEWVRVEGDTCVVGITEFAQSELGELVFVDLPSAGKSVSPGSTLCVVESTKAASDVYAPVVGTVAEANAALKDSPSLVNTEPYTGGWMVKLSGVAKGDLDKMLTVDQYKELLKGRI